MDLWARDYFMASLEGHYRITGLLSPLYLVPVCNLTA